MSHFLNDMLAFMTFKTIVKYISPQLQKEYDVNIFTERFRPRKSVGAIIYVVSLCTLQYYLSLGFNAESWFIFYIYEGYCMFRIFCFLEQFVPD
jgi:hypothetical protein